MTKPEPVAWQHDLRDRIQYALDALVDDNDPAAAILVLRETLRKLPGTAAALRQAREDALREAAAICMKSAEQPSSLWEAGAWAQCCEVNAESILAPIEENERDPAR